MELDTRIVGPAEFVHPEVVAQQPIPRGTVGLEIRHAEHRENAVGQEDEAAARAQQPRGFRDPAIGIAPQARPVLADCHIEALGGERRHLRVRVDQRKVQGELALKPSCV